MKENKLIIIVNKPIHEVFEFTTNPKNTHIWISSIKEEQSSEYPPKVGTIYKNTGDGINWDSYTVVEFEKDIRFSLADLEDNYHVRYTYRSINDTTTEMEYFEWMRDGELSNPYTKEPLEKMKTIVENL